MRLPPPITSRSNDRVKALRAALSGEPREPGEIIGIEGQTLIAEALRSKCSFDTVYVREGSEALLEVAELAGLEPRSWAVLSREVFSSAVGTSSPQGIAATLTIPDLLGPDVPLRPGTLLVLEDLQDPGNLGTLLRSAEAFSVRQVFVSPATANQWNPKVIRASAGSVFRVPVQRSSLADIKGWLRGSGVRLLAAVARSEEATYSFGTDLRTRCAIMIGNEGAGLSAEALAMADARVYIPCAVESLNAAVAGSTLLYEALRQNLLDDQGRGSAKAHQP